MLNFVVSCLLSLNVTSCGKECGEQGGHGLLVAGNAVLRGA